jgi:DNA-binding SARP family transcriptional activator
VLGGLEVSDGVERVELGTRKQRAVLAVLLLEAGRVVSVDRLVGEVWGDVPPLRAEASLQSYVSSLRRMLEPDRGPRQEPKVLVTQGGGYALAVGREDVDLWRFEDLVLEGRGLFDGGELSGAAVTLRNALAMYAPLLPEFEHEGFCRHPGLRVAGLHAAALELSYEVRLALGEHQLLVPDLEAAVGRYPLHEGLWALLAVARYRNGRQSEALRAVAECRGVLSEQTGVEPSPRLRQLEADLLAQAAHLDAPAPRSAGALVGVGDEPVARLVERAGTPIVGRRAELDAMAGALAQLLGGRRPLVIVEGEAGAGKTRLLEALAERAANDGAAVRWGRCAEGEGAPSMWPWVQIAQSLLTQAAPDERRALLAGPLGALVEGTASGVLAVDAADRFALFDAAVELARETVAAGGPLVVILDDLQWADAPSLELFEHLATRADPGLLLVGALRPIGVETSGALTTMLARASRLEGARRLVLGPLGVGEVAELMTAELGTSPPPATAAAIHARSGGNPFFVRELARSVERQGSPAVVPTAVPAGVRDVVRGRMARLPEATKEILPVAALIGRDVELGLLARAAGLDIDACLDRVEAAEAIGVLVPVPDDPFAYRFSHDLVREAVVEATAPLRAARLHLRIADALAQTETGGAARLERLAHHLWSAGPLADPARVARALLDAAQVAVRRSAYVTAEERSRRAIELARRAADELLELEALLAAVTVIGARVGYAMTDMELFERAEVLARRQGDERLAIDLLMNRWTTYSQSIQIGAGHPLAVQLRDISAASDDPEVRTYGLYAYGIDQWDKGMIGEARRSFEANLPMVDAWKRLRGGGQALPFSPAVFSQAFLAHVTALNGDRELAERRFAQLHDDGRSDGYLTIIWGSFCGLTAAATGDPAWAVRDGAPAIASDPDAAFEFLGVPLRICYWWGRALLDPADRPEALAEVEHWVAFLAERPARSGDSWWHVLHSQLLLDDGRLADAHAALDRAAESITRHGQVNFEPQMLLTRARVRRADGAPESEVRALIAAARTMADEREAFQVVEQADAILATLG